jgi:HD superfamily phosphodiesterase
VTRPNKAAYIEYGGKLVAFFNERFGSTYLPSHNLDHHLRVWTYAAGLVKQLRDSGFSFTDEFITALQIACHMHDIGLAYERSENHGKASEIIASEFLKTTDLSPALKDEILMSVRNHDRKDYVVASPPESMLTILSVADDMDAFGYIGIYRYIEIYLERGINKADIGQAVTSNLSTRYRHMRQVYGFLPVFLPTQTRRYEIARDFFNPEGPFAGSSREIIIEVIEKELLKKHKDIITIAACYKTANDDDIKHFFNNLHRELLLEEHV